MEALLFNRLKAHLATLSVEQSLKLSELLRKSAQSRISEVVVARGAAIVREARRCLLCGYNDVVLHGRDANHRQRFRCRRGTSPRGATVGCGRTFNGLAGTVLARMRKPEKWLGFAAEIEAHVSVTRLAERTGIARLTAFRWRGRLLSVQERIETSAFKGVIEMDKTYFRTFYKGPRAWKLGRPPENRRPRYRGGPALSVGLSGEQVPLMTAVDRTEGVLERSCRTVVTSSRHSPGASRRARSCAPTGSRPTPNWLVAWSVSTASESARWTTSLRRKVENRVEPVRSA